MNNVSIMNMMFLLSPDQEERKLWATRFETTVTGLLKGL